MTVITRTAPRLVPDQLLQLKLTELGIRGRGLQNGHVRLRFDQFTGRANPGPARIRLTTLGRRPNVVNVCDYRADRDDAPCARSTSVPH